jgi:hypothetical protein
VSWCGASATRTIGAKVLAEMTELGQRLVGNFYAPLASEGAAMLERYSLAELKLLRDFLLDAKELTDRHRSGIQHETESTPQRPSDTDSGRPRVQTPGPPRSIARCRVASHRGR